MAARIGMFLLVAALAWPREAQALAWTRRTGGFYLGLQYGRIAGPNQFGTAFERAIPNPLGHYEQHVLSLYGELGLIDRLLTLSVDSQLFRQAAYGTVGVSHGGAGDFRVGLWSGLVDKPLRFSVGLILGVPSGNPSPERSRPDASDEERRVLALLPTGDGEVDVEARAAIGYSFGGARRWPLQHFVAAEVGYWWRSRGIQDGITWKVDFGVRFPWKVIERFWFILHLNALHSRETQSDLVTRDLTGLKNGVTYIGYGADLYGRIFKGLGAQIGIDSAIIGRAVPAHAQFRVGLSYQY